MSTNNHFIKSAMSLAQCPQDNVNEICLVGRSNVGKSSLINAIAQSKIARTSKRPGMTQTLNFYSILDKRIVDLPGYGYAQLDKAKKVELSDLIGEFVSNRTNIKKIFHIIDSGVITGYDKEVSEFIRKHCQADYYILANKIDKLKQSELHNLSNKISEYLKINRDNLILISALKQKNINTVIKLIKEL